MTWEDQVANVDTPEARAERARVALQAALDADNVAEAARALFHHADLAGFADCAPELEQLRCQPRCGALTGRLERASKAAARRSLLRVAGEDEPSPVLRDAVGAPTDWPAYNVPTHYQATPSGIVRLERVGRAVVPSLVAEEPCGVVGVRVDVGTGHESLVIGYRRHGDWRRVVVPREHARDSKRIVELAGVGLPVSSDTSRPLVRWLSATEDAAGAELERSRCTTRTGWHGDLYVQGPGGELELEDPDDARAGWTAAGTWEGWLDALDGICTEPAPWLVLYAASVAPLLRWMALGHNPIVDLWGPRGRGKTTCLRFAGSGWGRPDDGQGGTILTWDSTPTSIERMAARTWDAPLLLDDTKRAAKPQHVQSALYALAQGRGRGRGTPGGVQRTATWRTATISTGEAPLVEATEAGGAKMRVLSLGITPAISSLAVAKRLEAGICTNYGHLGPRVAARALELGSGLRDRYLEVLARWSTDSLGADTRLLSTCAAIEVAHDVVREVGVPEPEADWRTWLVDALDQSIIAGDQSERALDRVRDELARHQHQYRGQEIVHDSAGHPVAQRDYRGIWREDDDWVGLYPGTLQEILEGHDLTTLLELWIERDVLMVNRGRQWETGVTKGVKQRVYAFRRSHVL
ncbi:MAG TPA: DUF927 domain-containing protein [Actinomycetota bacterium]|jgi:hypothetical protein